MSDHHDIGGARPAGEVPVLDYGRLEGMVQTLATAMARDHAQGDAAKLQADYQATVELIKLFTDIRFRCLAFVTAVTALANVLLADPVEPGMRISLGVVGFVATLGIAIYELRNSQLYESAMHRAKFLEARLEMTITSHSSAGGLFTERPPYVDGKYKNRTVQALNRAAHAGELPLLRFLGIRVKHDHGLAFIYGAALGGWSYLAAYGLLSMPVPPGAPWRAMPPAWLWSPAALIAAVTAGIIIREFIYHDKNRYSLYTPDGAPGLGAEPETVQPRAASAAGSS